MAQTERIWAVLCLPLRISDREGHLRHELGVGIVHFALRRRYALRRHSVGFEFLVEFIADCDAYLC